MPRYVQKCNAYYQKIKMHVPVLLILSTLFFFFFFLKIFSKIPGMVTLTPDFVQLLPWGGKLTSESIKFFSPVVIWTKFTPNQQKYDALYSAFVDFYKV